MILATGTANFPRMREAAQPPQVVSVALSGPVSRATAIMTGFNVQFSPQGGDHHLGQLDVRVTTGAPSGNVVPVTVFFDLRDWSGNRDDYYEGQVFFTVVGE
ncbi:MAG: hypothetical protein MUF21_09380 [Gemmatimonadaceae bacterium]|nr:hypothetical protein [Gemmatimonadaceae bacterium]